VFFKVKPREDVFFTCFESSADVIYNAARILQEYVYKGGNPIDRLELLSQAEERGKKLFDHTVDRLNSTFITPFDREDIYSLAKELNQVIDHIHGTMEKIVIYKTGRPRDINVRGLTDVLVMAADEIRDAVTGLRKLQDNYERVLEACDRISEYEREGDRLYRAGTARLFEETDDAIEIIKWKEVLEHLETTLDYCEDVSNVLKGVAVKYA
jgi:uncharacterized protein Yka (UPF0111/DUF47 family)